MPEDNFFACHRPYIESKILVYNTSGIGAFNPGILRLGYDGGGPYLCIAINHGGGTFSDDCNIL